ncbi:uncharacterized protein LOC105664975 [Ceratitis capitata]|uniref:uncharacterized protein LOC105664975 n=1 Tax=Ceratitis capitata TaxID=7213 RepID=UPI000C6C7A79|nr:uncharacterized protein LOC105664975 [Ceratitis capitata]
MSPPEELGAVGIDGAMEQPATYTYTLRIPASRIGDHKLHYERLLRDNTTNDYKQLSTITKEAVDRLVMQSDFRDIYHGVQLTAFSPIVGIIKHMEIKANVEPTGISANFLLQIPLMKTFPYNY